MTQTSADAATARDEARDEARNNPFDPGQHAPGDYVQIRVTEAERVRFNTWFRSQFPGVKLLPKKEEWQNRAFAIGVAELERRMPALDSPEARFAAAFGDEAA